jgi:hypothetical protein
MCPPAGLKVDEQKIYQILTKPATATDVEVNTITSTA